MTVATDLLGMSAPLRLALRHLMIASPPVISLQPSRIGLPAQPLGSRCRQGIESSPQGLGYALETVQRAHCPKHMGGVGARPTPDDTACDSFTRFRSGSGLGDNKPCSGSSEGPAAQHYMLLKIPQAGRVGNIPDEADGSKIT